MPKTAPPELAYRFGLITKPHTRGRPVVFSDALALARSIHRRRAGAPIALEDVDTFVRLPKLPEVRLNLVRVIREGPDGAQILGLAYLDGASYRALSRALRETQPDLARAA